MTSEPWSEERLAAALARCERATAGPWVVEWDQDYDEFQDRMYHFTAAVRPAFPCLDEHRDEDAEFIAHARADLPDALTEIARLTAALARAEAVLAPLRPYVEQRRDSLRLPLIALMNALDALAAYDAAVRE